MDKLIKLPLFLGIAGAACAGILAGVNAITTPIIESNKEKAENTAYYETFKEFGNEDTLVVDKTLTVSDELKNAGVSVKASVTNGSDLDGMVYTCSVLGSATAGRNTISFQIAFANGKYYHYTDLGNTETPSFGGNKVINVMNTYISNLDASTALSSYQAYVDGTSGASETARALSAVIDLCAADYKG